MRPVILLMIVAVLTGCASGPKPSSTAGQLSELDAKHCEDISGMTSDLAALRERSVGKRQAIKLQLAEREIKSLDREERVVATSELYETAIIVYAIPDLSPASLEAFKWAECKAMALHGSVLNYSDIVAIKHNLVRCQSDFEEKSASKHKTCIEGVVKDRSQVAELEQMVEQGACRKLIRASIKLHNKAVRMAKKGKKDNALASLETTMSNWKKIAGGELSCSNIDKAIAADGILRATQDILSVDA